MDAMPTLSYGRMGGGEPQYFITLRNVVGRSYGSGAYTADHKTILKGLIVKAVPCELEPEDVVVQIILSDTDLADYQNWVIKKCDVSPVISSLVPALLGISNWPNRLAIAEDLPLCRQLAKIKQGSNVYIINSMMDLSEREPALVHYVGPVTEMGPVAHYYGVSVKPGSAHGENDGSILGRRYFFSASKCGVFVPLDRISIDLDHKASNDAAHMQPSNANNNDSANYCSTRVLHMKKKDSMPRIQTAHVEKTEKLIDLDAVDDGLLKIGDRIVWVNDNNEPELGTVRWLGILACQGRHAGVDFDNPVGSGTGYYKKEMLFRTEMKHASFIPVSGLIKAKDYFAKPKVNIEKKLNTAFIVYENNNGSGSSSSQLHKPDPIKNTGKSDASVQSRHPDLVTWTSSVVQLPDCKEDNIKKHSTTRELSFPPPQCTVKETVPHPQYIFSEPIPNINVAKAKFDSANKQVVKDVNKTNFAKRMTINLDSYPIGEARPRDYFSSGDLSSDKRREGTYLRKPNQTKIRHSYSQDLQLNSNSTLNDLRLEQRDKAKTATQNNNKELEMNIEGFISELRLNNEANNPAKGNDVDEAVLTVSPVPSLSSEGDYYDTPDPIGPDPVDLDVGSVVEVSVKDSPRYGVIRWIGTVPEDSKGRKVAGIEMEDELIGCSDGTFNGRRYFQCNPKKALFVGLNQCQKDGRFQEPHPHIVDNKVKSFGPDDCPVIPGAVKPRCICKVDEMATVCGKYRGIQGHHNSCYLDATLFSMFAFTSAFDSLLFRPRTQNDVPHYEEVQRVLREEIVNPLRMNQYCKWDRVMKLRTLLENHSSVTGLTSEEKDPEEFLTSLVAQILRAKPFLKLSSGQEAYHYQLFVDKDEHLRSPSVQQLFEQSFFASDIKLKEIPSCLIIQMPRFGKSYKMYPRIFPSTLLDVTDIIEDSPRHCTVCGKLAEYECRECFGKSGIGITLESISYCGNCIDTVHSHQLRICHKYRPLTVPIEFSILKEHCPIPRLYMQLFAVVCIETSHYVSFVKCGSNADSPWCFFDSMADRKGEQNGYNIPQVVSCPDLPYWLSEEGTRSLCEVTDDRQLPEHAKRLLCDAYMCMYQSTEMMMYR